MSGGDIFAIVYVTGGMLMLTWGAYAGAIRDEKHDMLTVSIFVFAVWPILAPLVIGERLRHRASAIEARRVETERLDAKHESAVAKPDAPEQSL